MAKVKKTVTCDALSYFDHIIKYDDFDGLHPSMAVLNVSFIDSDPLIDRLKLAIQMMVLNGLMPYQSDSKKFESILESNFRYRWRSTRVYEISDNIRKWLGLLQIVTPISAVDFIYKLNEYTLLSNTKPVRFHYHSDHREFWLYKSILYEINGVFSEEQVKLLILEEFDKERKLFERLKLKHDSSDSRENEGSYDRARIPEHVRIEVWRRDSGKCVKCGSRANLEYDHIIPVSKGGGNTARNIELLCESCNRRKGANIE